MDHIGVEQKFCQKSTVAQPQKHRKNRVLRNKLYCTEGDYSASKLEKLERGFVLDCVAVAQISEDYSTINPKGGSVIPVYDAQSDPFAKYYFEAKGVQGTCNGQKSPGICMKEPFVARFAEHGPPAQYLRLRNVHGCGRSPEVFEGHNYSDTAPTTVIGYNGMFGYRRNTPFLRKNPSSFGIVTDLPLY
ncbi:hypothetical protein D915_008849 [Fasciola hepatica]|uniref:Uncharacterized protein n=1 Tax=Fasciola hepatica TaxID=6192 RepID=A0A2H1BWZ9_FASHE|nr:hypothetical protein D915_008849 [Fasciola hepatica]